MDFKTYVDIKAVNASWLKEMRKSPLHFKHRGETPREDSTRFALGRGAHTAVFEPDRFMLDYALFSGERRAGKEWNECCAANKGRTILKEAEYQTCLAMRDAVRSHPIAGPLLTPPGEAEKVITWTDEETGLDCKARLDWWRPGLLADLKTAADIDPRRFAANAYRMGYFMQMAFYALGLRANGLDASGVRIIAVEAAAPHDVAVFALDDDAMWAGEMEVHDLLRLVAAGRFSGKWPGRYPAEVPLSLPAWAFADGAANDDSFAGLDLLVTGTEG